MLSNTHHPLEYPETPEDFAELRAIMDYTVGIYTELQNPPPAVRMPATETVAAHIAVLLILAAPEMDSQVFLADVLRKACVVKNTVNLNIIRREVQNG